MSIEKDNDQRSQRLLATISKLVFVIVVLLITLVAMPFIIEYEGNAAKRKGNVPGSAVAGESKSKAAITYWIPPALTEVTDDKLKAQLEYGKDLIAHTAKYFGPNGSVSKTSNGMNCQNCHLQAGTAVYGNNYGSVASLYPKFRARSGSVENTYKRVNDCFERSLNGKAIDTGGKEMQAIAAYISYIGSNVEKGKKAAGSGFKELAYLDRATNPANGQTVYTTKCQSCHQQNGEGLLSADKIEYTYPPLWGGHSYNDGAGLYRISNFAKYVKYNMPLGATHEDPQLTDEEAWDVAAFINAQPRPHIAVQKDWPDIAKKPVDHPFGPYADGFTEHQHKFGPYKPIADEQQKKGEAEKKAKEKAGEKK